MVADDDDDDDGAGDYLRTLSANNPPVMISFEGINIGASSIPGATTRRSTSILFRIESYYYRGRQSTWSPPAIISECRERKWMR